MRVIIHITLFIIGLLIGFFLLGCYNPAVLEKCPVYFQENIGEISYEPLNPLGLLFRGLVDVQDPNGTIHLYITADNDVLLEEMFHSFEIRAGHNRYDEWEQFYYAFHSDGSTYKDYGGAKLSALIVLCWPFLNGQYHNVSHFEDTAYHFVRLMNGRPIDNDKTKAVEEFINGRASNTQ